MQELLDHNAILVTMSDLNELFRHHPRLAKKLSNDELRGLKHYIDKQVFQQNHKLISRLTLLESVVDLNTSRHEENVEKLSVQMKEDRELAAEYRREVTSLSGVLKSREARSKARVEKLESELENRRRELDDLTTTRDELQAIVSQKNDVIDENNKRIAELQTTCLKLVKEREDSKEISRLSNEILKMKYSSSNKDKEISDLRKQLDKTATKWTCDGSGCPASRYLEQCRRELIAKCEETAILNFQIENGKRKLKEHQKFIERKASS